MKNSYKILSSAILLLMTAACLHAQTHTANVGVVKQEQDQWCWAADSKCILDYYGFVLPQCSIVEYARTVRPGGYFGSKNCCPLSSGVCNKPNEIKENYGIEGMLSHFGQLNSQVNSGTLSVTKIIAELKAQKPFVMGIMWNGGGGHVVVGCGYNETTQSLTMMDSWQNNGMTTKKYTGGSSVSTNSGSGNWAEHLVMLSTPTSVNNLNASENLVDIFPNPSLSSTNITVSSDKVLKSILVFNSMGQLVNSYKPVSDKSFSLKIPVTGFYSLQVITEEGTTNKKIIVQ